MNHGSRPWPRVAQTAWILIVCAALCSPTVAAWAGDGPEPLVLRINDGSGVAGDVLAVVLRTYSPRGISLGQICVLGCVQNCRQGSPANELTGGVLGDGSTDASEAGNGPLLELLDVVVFSQEGDAVYSSTFDGPEQMAVVEFESTSASVNLSDGPMLAFFFRLDPNLPPTAEFEIRVELADSFLLDGSGTPIVVEPRAGEFVVRDPLAPYALSADGDEVAPGGNIDVAVATEESLPLASGHVALDYDPSIFLGTPALIVDPRYGQIEAAIEHPSPGRVEVGFESTSHTLNRLPGDFLRFRFLVDPSTPVGSQSPLSLDATATFLLDADLQSVDLELESDVVDVVADQALFVDGFESADTSAWDVSIP